MTRPMTPHEIGKQLRHQAAALPRPSGRCPARAPPEQSPAPPANGQKPALVFLVIVFEILACLFVGRKIASMTRNIFHD